MVSPLRGGWASRNLDFFLNLSRIASHDEIPNWVTEPPELAAFRKKVLFYQY